MGKVHVVCSTLVLAEVYKTPRDDKGRRRSDLIKQQIESPAVHLVDVSPVVAKRAAELRSQYNFHTPDSIHLATALLEKVDWFITLDKRLAKPLGSLKTPEGVKPYLLTAETARATLPWMMGQDMLSADMAGGGSIATLGLDRLD